MLFLEEKVVSAAQSVRLAAGGELNVGFGRGAVAVLQPAWFNGLLHLGKITQLASKRLQVSSQLLLEIAWSKFGAQMHREAC